jgi:hypothetical protein
LRPGGGLISFSLIQRRLLQKRSRFGRIFPEARGVFTAKPSGCVTSSSMENKRWRTVDLLILDRERYFVLAEIPIP